MLYVCNYNAFRQGLIRRLKSVLYIRWMMLGGIESTDLSLFCFGGKKMGYERTPVKTEGYTLSDLRKKFNCGAATAVRIRKRGYITKKTKIQTPLKDMSMFDVEMAYKAAEVMFWKKFRYLFKNALDHFDDMKQACVLRMVERSAEIATWGEKTWTGLCGIAVFEMHNYLKQMHIRNSNFTGKICSFELNVEGDGLYAIA